MPGFGDSPGFYRRQLFDVPPPPPADLDLSTKCILLTGATSGLGYQCAMHLIQHNVKHLILPVRSRERGEKTKEQLLRETKATSAPVIDLYELDLESYTSVVSFVEKLRAQLKTQLDVAILNAGVNKFKRTVTSQAGVETVLQVNHLSTALMALLLLPLLRTNAQRIQPGRITLVNSENHMWTDFMERDAPNILDALDAAEDKAFGNDQYGNVKLINLLWARALAARRQDVVVNLVNPGFSRTGIAREIPFLMRPIYLLITFLVGRKQEVAARTLTHGAVVAGDDTHGQYLSECRVSEVSPIIHGEEGHRLEEQVWQETLEKLRGVADIDSNIQDGFQG